MMEKIVFFDKISEIEEITGLSDDKLWENGFNLDDMDGGFYIEENEDLQVVEKTNVFGYKFVSWKTDPEELYWNNKMSFCLYRLLDDLENYCVGYDLAAYSGKIFILAHHA